MEQIIVNPINLGFWMILDKAAKRWADIHHEENILTESNPATFGNVEFWRDTSGGWCYSLPVGKWDIEKIINDIQFHL